MSRRIVRPALPSPPTPAANQRRHKLQTRLDAARRGFERWLAKLMRACRAVEKQKLLMARLERQIHQLEET